MTQLTLKDIWATLNQVRDPEIPVLSVVDLGIVRDVILNDQAVRIRVTPTFTGCPAQLVMTGAIVQALRDAGARSVEVETVLDPPWSTDWIDERARIKLRDFGIAISDRHGGRIDQALESSPECPYCGSKDTGITTPFGSTRCKSICVCRSCNQPFEWIKPL